MNMNGALKNGIVALELAAASVDGGTNLAAR